MKPIIKTMLVLLVLMSSITSTRAQVVHDPLTWFQQLWNTRHAAREMANTAAILEDAKKIQQELKEVSNTVQKYKRVRETAELIYESSRLCADGLSRITKDPNITPQEMAAILKAYGIFLKESRAVFDLLKIYTQTDEKFSSGERLTKIDEAYEKVQEINVLIGYFTREIAQTSMIRAKNRNDLVRLYKLYGF